MSGRSARRDRRQAAAVGTVLSELAAARPDPPKPETIRSVIDAVGALESMGDAAFEQLLAGYRDVDAAKGATFAYAWLMYNLERYAGLTAVRAMAAAGVLAAHRTRQAEAEASAEKLARVEWLRWAIDKMTSRVVAASAEEMFPGGDVKLNRRWTALDRLTDALAREASC